MNNKLIFRISILILFVSGFRLSAQTDLECRGFVNSSAGTNCDFQLVAQELLATDITGRTGLEITIGQFVGIDTLVIGSSYLNQTLNFSVKDTLTNISCWGRILFEDVLIPDPVCKNDTVSCTESLSADTSSLPVPDDIKARIGYEAIPIANSPCFNVYGWDECGPVILCFEERTLNLTCDDLFCSVLYRTWTLTDSLISPNKPQEKSCVDTIYISLPDRSLLTSPPNWLKPDSAISCADLNHNRIIDREEDIYPANSDGSFGNKVLDQDEGKLFGVTHENSEVVIDGDTKAWIPTPDITGYPNGIECTDCLILHWKDHVIEGSCSRFIERTWKIRGWCSNHDLDTTFVQQIKIIDDEAPVIVGCIDQVTLYVSGHACTTVNPLPIPEAYDACEEHKYLKGVNYSVSSDKGQVIKQGEDYLLDLDLSKYIDGTGPHSTDATITWVVDDGCNNRDTCIYIARVEDNIPPVAVAISNIQVSLTTDGLGKLFATDDIDGGSYDNCGELYFKVLRFDDEEVDGRKHGSRSNNADPFSCDGLNGDDSNDKDADGKELGFEVYFDDYVKFCCEDINEQVRVIYRVYDWLPAKWRQGPVPREAHESGGELYGHYNDQWTLVKVEDKLGALNCPSDIVINCNEHLPSLEVTGNTVCGELDVEFVGEEDERDNCGIGVLYRKWRTLLPDGSYVHCSQKITILPLPLDTFFIYDETCENLNKDDGVIWPCNILIDCPSSLNDLSPEALESQPVIFDELGACPNVFVGYDDIVLYNSTDACLKILRTWVVIDWCGNPINNLKPRWFYEQNIKLIDNIPPTLEVDVITKCDSISDCKVYSRIEVLVEDACSDMNQISIDYTIDDGDIIGNGAVYEGFLTPGEHKIYFSVLDGCNNYAFIEKTVNIDDCKPPTPVCNIGIGTVVMPSNGEVQIWARELDAGTKEDCEELIFGIRRAVNDGEELQEFTAFIILTCDDFFGGQTSTVYVDMQVTDAYGNSAFCTSFVNLQDNANVCPDKPSIGGTITMNNGTPITGHEVVLTNTRNAVIQTAISDVNGQYNFPNIDGAEKVFPRKNDDVINGVNTLDVIAIQRHFLGISVFEQAQTYIAADATNDQNINVLDLLEIQKVILGVQSKFASNQSWRYMMSKDVPDLSNPYDFTEKVDLLGLNLSQIQDINFIGVKVGDVNESVRVTGFSGSVSSRSNLEMNINPDHVEFGNHIRIPVTSSNFNDIDGYQLTLSFNANALQFVVIESGKLQIEDFNVASHLADEGVITHNWYDTEAVSYSEDEVLFTLVFESHSGTSNLTDLNEIQITDDIIQSEYYRDNGMGSISLIVGKRSALEAFKLYQNAPNPFNERTVIGYNLSADSEVSIMVHDSQGKLIIAKNVLGTKGYNEQSIHSDELGGANGVLYYTISHDKQKITKKMVRSD